MHKLATARMKKFGRLNDGQDHFIVSDYFQKLSDGTLFYRGEDNLGNHYFATKEDLIKIIENREFFLILLFYRSLKFLFFINCQPSVFVKIWKMGQFYQILSFLF